MNSSDDFESLEIKAGMLVNALDEVVTAKETDSLEVNEMAAALIAMSNDLGP